MRYVFFFQAEDGIRDKLVTGVQTCALPIWGGGDLLGGDRRRGGGGGRPQEEAGASQAAAEARGDRGADEDRGNTGPGGIERRGRVLGRRRVVTGQTIRRPSRPTARGRRSHED